ncbi:hypothetical protein DF185_22670 [Marinifilum breve]|uniref:Fibronectin type-III domain-containing protein n=1 Tax=Marinifilum breve TaxID=2184082 RepID=A0A2V3ZR40_9BACT|nr:hypothetical protein [Marinifilum breve]PXX95185.1 hypothetical protein DF185_22670 [Marinifilum breve]
MRKQYYLLPLILIAIIYSCSDFTEEDIENDKLTLLGPADGVSTETQTLTFWWDFVEGADSYRLQIADPNFEGIVRLELDTLVSSNQFEHTLYPGDFEWRVRAENSAYTSEYFSRNLSILEPVDITKQKVVLVTPGKEAKVNQKQIEFKWDELKIANEYQFELHQDDWSGEDIMDPKVLAETKLTLELEEGKYAWGVLARDSEKKEETPFTYRNIVVDLTEPNLPTLSAPANNANVNGLSQSFSWNHSEENELTDVSFVLQIFSDKDLKTLVAEKSTSLKTYDYTFTETGTYYWRVKAMDEAGNESEYSSSFSFSIANE